MSLSIQRKMALVSRATGWLVVDLLVMVIFIFDISLVPLTVLVGIGHLLKLLGRESLSVEVGLS